MAKTKFGLVLLALVTVFLAGFLTWNLFHPKEADGFYHFALGSVPDAPPNEVIAQGTIVFEKAEADRNG